MDPFTMAAIMGGVGLGKSLLVDVPREKKERELAANTAMYSPWTHMNPQMPKNADPFGSVLQGAGSGFMMGQAADANEMARKELELKYPQQAASEVAAGAAESPLNTSGYAGSPSYIARAPRKNMNNPWAAIM